MTNASKNWNGSWTARETRTLFRYRSKVLLHTTSLNFWSSEADARAAVLLDCTAGLVPIENTEVGATYCDAIKELHHLCSAGTILLQACFFFSFIFERIALHRFSCNAHELFLQWLQSHHQSMRRPPKSAEIWVLRPGRSHIQAVFAPMAEEEGDIGLLSVVVWAFLAQCDHFLNKIEFVKDLSLRTKTCDKFFSQFLAEIVQRWLRWFLDGIAVQNFGCVHRETEDYTRKSEILER